MSATARVQLPFRTRLRSGVIPRLLSPPGWGVVGVTAGFIGLTCWWLTQDRSVPIFDAGDHLGTAIYYHHLLQTGDLLGPLNHISQYPPLAHLVGALAMFLGGVNVATPIIAENLIFVSLLTLGCYQTGRLLFGRSAGLLAAIFVLGSPLLITQLHVFMLDAPETALVSVSMWLLLASECFSRTNIAALAGLAVGCGLLVKVQFPFFLAGIVLTAFARGGWRHWRGVAVFVVIALAVGGPWYIDHFSELSTITKLAGASSGAVAGNLPPILSTANLTWYFWSTLNSQLLAPLFALVLVGTIWTIVMLARRKELRAPRLEFLLGGFVAWLAISVTPHHDIRYDMPLMPYLAVVGTGWVVYLRGVRRLLVTTVLLLAVAANTLGATLGVGKPIEVNLVKSPPATEASPDKVVLYSNQGFLVAGPQRDGDVPGLLKELRRDGVEIITFNIRETVAADFSFEGLFPLAEIAGLLSSFEVVLARTNPKAVVLLHRSTSPEAPPMCTRLSDGTGIWIVRAQPKSNKLAYYCPSRHPQFYQ